MTKRLGSHLRLVASNGKRVKAVKTWKQGSRHAMEEQRIRLVATRIYNLVTEREGLDVEPRELARMVKATPTEVRRAISYLAVRKMLDVFEE